MWIITLSLRWKFSAVVKMSVLWETEFLFMAFLLRFNALVVMTWNVKKHKSVTHYVFSGQNALSKLI